MRKYWWIALFALFTFACGGDSSPTSPAPEPNTYGPHTVLPQATPEEPVTVAPVVEEEEGAPGCEFIAQWPTLIVDCTTVNHIVSKRIHFFKNGPHPQERIGFFDIEIAPRSKATFDLINILTGLLEPCEEYNGQIQWDVTHQSTPSDAPSDGLGHIFRFGINSVNVKAEICEPECEEEPVIVGEPELISTEWSGECVRPVAQNTVVPESCIEYGLATYRITYQQCDMLWFEDVVRRVRRSCECEGETCEELPVMGLVLDKESNPYNECAAYGEFVPVCKTENISASNGDGLPSCDNVTPDFYICKQATKMVSQADDTVPCGGIEPEGWSHITGCICPQED